MKHQNIFIIGLLFVAIGAIGLYSVRNWFKNVDIIGSGSGSSKNVASASNNFAIDYYSKLAGKESGNIFFSPFSISSALAMTYEGARGQTAEEMQQVFHFPEDAEVRRNEYANLFSLLNKPDNKYKLSVANALWAQNDYPFSSEFFKNVEKYYGGKVTNLDFINNTEKSRVTINSWVEDKTNDKIKDLIPGGVLGRDTRLVLTNAIYFKGSWVKEFNPDETRDQTFRSNGKELNVPMMQRTDEEVSLNYFENDSLQILELPYSGEDLSMVILLPKEDDPTSLEKKLSAEDLSIWQKDVEKQRVKVYLPKFKFETKYMMADDLKEMGMPMAFSELADFSGMLSNTNEKLQIDAVIHQAFVDVNEEGTEAAAATAVTIGLTSVRTDVPKIPVFRADHPFIFLIRENSTGTILFMGRVSDPSVQ